MGVDIYGVDPILRSMGPEEIDWTTATDEQIDKFYTEKREHETLNPGIYFRASWWSWRPIVGIVEMLAPEIDTAHWHYNDGHGLDAEDSKALAELIQKWIDENNLYDESSDVIHVNFGSWQVVGEDQRLNSSDTEHLDILYPIGQITPGSIVTPEGLIVKTSHAVSLEHLKEFVAFLKECNGFKIH